MTNAAQETGARMLVLFGSRARGHVHPHSDWDLGYLGAQNVELLRERLANALATDAIDLVDLATGSALLRMRVGSEGKLLYESEPGIFLRFQNEAAHFWCDVEPVLSDAYAKILAEARST